MERNELAESKVKQNSVVVIIPALNEEENIGRVIGDIPKKLVSGIIVVDNGSEDDTARVARKAGARVVAEPRAGYGSACLRGLSEAVGADTVVFIDGDYSDYPEQMPLLLEQIERGFDMVVGSRMTGRREPGALPLHSLLGNWLVTFLINITTGTRYTDLGPFRAVGYEKLMAAGMKDTDYGWTVEMALRAAAAGWKVCEVPVRYRKRHGGKSKITGSLAASVKTAWKMFSVLSRLKKQLRRELAQNRKSARDRQL